VFAAHPQADLDLTVATDLGMVGATEWDALTGHADPFLEHAFLRALEASNVIGPQTVCEPRYILARRAGTLVGAAALFVKWDSYGEFVFDWAWAEAYQRAQISYYPKAIVAAPFTPVTGARLLVAAGEPFAETAGALVDRMLALVAEEELSGLHFLFVPREECELLASHGFMPRLSHQFHWLNRGYRGFEDFLSDLRSGKRKQVRKERRRVAESGLHIEVVEGDDVKQEHLDAIWRFYAANVERHWSQAYFNRETFARLGAEFRHRLVLVLARDGDRWIAGALNARKNDGLYGRYWGCERYIPELHFECCYYRLIDYAIAERIRVFEAGAQGEHKFLRGFVARPTYSAHWLAHPGGRAAVGSFLEEERTHVLDLIERYNSVSPLKVERA
jgi:uncharacterized protein